LNVALFGKSVGVFVLKQLIIGESGLTNFVFFVQNILKSFERNESAHLV